MIQVYSNALDHTHKAYDQVRYYEFESQTLVGATLGAKPPPFGLKVSIFCGVIFPLVRRPKGLLRPKGLFTLFGYGQNKYSSKIVLHKEQLEQIIERARTSITRVFLSLTSGVINGFFLIIWAVMQWCVSLVINSLQLTGITGFTLTLFQVSFAIATAAPILINIYADIRIAIIQARKRIQREEELSEPDSPNDSVVLARQNQNQIQSKSRLTDQSGDKGKAIDLVTPITKEGTDDKIDPGHD